MKCPNMVCSQKQRWCCSNHLRYESKFLDFVNSLHFFCTFFDVCENLTRGELPYKSPRCVVQLIWQHDLKGKEWKREGRKAKKPESYAAGSHQPEGHGNPCWKEKREAVIPWFLFSLIYARPWSVYSLELMSVWVIIEWFFRCLKAWHWKYPYMEIKCYSETEQDTI